MALKPDDAAGISLVPHVVDVFKDALGVESVGADDDFFALGGDSLVAVEVMLAVEERFGASLPLPLIFEAPTPRQLARELSAALFATTGSTTPGPAT